MSQKKKSPSARNARSRRPHAAQGEPAEAPEHVGLRDLTPREDLAAAGEREGSPAMPVIALIGTTLFMAGYYHLLVLNQMTQLADGLAMPDNRFFGYSAADVAALAAVMDEAALGQLNWVHKTAGVIFPIAVALTLIAVSAWRLRPAGAKWAMVGLGVLFVVVDVWENIAIEAALHAAGDGVGLASGLTVTRWVLLALITLIVVVLLAFGGKGRTRR